MSAPGPTARQLEIAAAVKRYKTQAAAARALGIRPSTVGRAVRAVGGYRAATGRRTRALTPGERAFARNLLAAVAELTPAQLDAGRIWWAKARADVTGIASRYLFRSFGGYENIARATAAVSAGLRWDATLEVMRLLLEAMVRDEPTYPRQVGHMTFGYAARDKAWRILNGDPRALSGPKVEAVFANLMGDESKVAVDRHVTRVATLGVADQVGSASVVEIQEAMVQLAKLARVTPAALQAALWCAAREGK